MKQNENAGEKKQSGTLPPINYYPSRKEWERACWQEILISQKLLELLITVYERHNLIMRAVALDRLIAGKTYKQISEELRLSPQTISVIKKTLTEKNYRSYLERSKKERKKRIYSSGLAFSKQKPRGIPRRTKYGTIYIP